MRPPFTVCRLHCPHYGRCEPHLSEFTAAEAAGEPHPLALALLDGCKGFRVPIDPPVTHTPPHSL